MISREEAKNRILRKIEIFREHLQQYKLNSYKEDRLKLEFIEEFFYALGWDIRNEQGLSEQYKEVIKEDELKDNVGTKEPDYAFRLFGKKHFLVEVKKPSVDIDRKLAPAFQLRKYGWNAEISIGILTDFEQFSVYDCRIKPKETDKPDVARIMHFTFEDYEKRFDEIYDAFSKEAVSKGRFDKFVFSNKDKRGTSEVSNEFLKEIEKWRDNLAKNIALRNPNITINELNYVIQKIIDRILFLIIAECKNIEKYGKLGEIAKKEAIYKNLMPYFKDSDDKYNSGIFDFKKDTLTPTLIVDDKILKEIIENLYYPISPYDFSVLPIEILGKVYEKFLGKTVRLTSSHQAKVEEKPEVRKAGGVYYTPEFIVNYIIENTVGKKIQGKTPKQIESIKILDSACGSGTFLVRAYTYILDYLLSYYIKNPEKYKKEIYQVRKDKWFLTTEVRKNVLLNNIYGVDIDAQAVEVTKLSLLLKVLENQTKESINQQLKLFNERALPNLDKNIKCGNSIVNSSYFSQQKLNALSTDELEKINPFDWGDDKNGFGNIIKNGGFDVIIGNPPYVKEDVNREIFEVVNKTDMAKYYQGKMDFWNFFTCKALDLLKEGGLHSYIAQNSWVTSSGASILRNKILTDSKIISFFDFNDFRVFKDASIQTMIFVLEKQKTNKAYSVDYYKVLDKDISKEELTNYLMTKKDGDKIEKFKAKINPLEIKEKLINFTNNQVGEILDKIQKKGNYFLKTEDIGNGIDVLQDFVNETHLKTLKEEAKKGDGIFVLSNSEMKKLNFNKKEMEKIKQYYLSEQLKKYYGNSNNNYWIIYADLEVRENINNYPHIKEHLDKFKRILTSAFKPYGLNRPREQRFFEGEKIFSLRKTKKVSFTYTNFPCYVSRAFLIIKTNDINQKYLTGLLNSKLINFWLYHKGKRQGEQLQIDKEPLLAIPLIKSENKEIIEAVDLIIGLKKRLENLNLDREKDLIKKQMESLEKKIDNIIYSLYGLSEEDKEVIRNS
ncbi:MAG: DNA methyltransferase [Nanoarchaeota archaeon]